ncbi:hypothetical protein NDU88_002279 [Pleurodeles waltl]|uniref:Uncharacterized protein n=1 Tax=Pleurodeles waltl TaxID=8319 RepID=A0AAV7W1R0_PLEWA|nr:hypothetical protein NDU88_002279 [Pleurodeles waltl]
MPATSFRPTMKRMAHDAGSKTRTAGRFPKGSKSKSVTPPVRRQRQGLGSQDPEGFPRDLKDSSDSKDSTGLQVCLGRAGCVLSQRCPVSAIAYVARGMRNLQEPHLAVNFVISSDWTLDVEMKMEGGEKWSNPNVKNN